MHTSTEREREREREEGGRERKRERKILHPNINISAYSFNHFQKLFFVFNWDICYDENVRI